MADEPPFNPDDPPGAVWSGAIERPSECPETLDGNADAEPVTDLTEANWHLRKIARAIQHRNELAAVYDAEMERLRLRWLTRLERIEADIAWHTAPLESYMQMRMREDPKLRTLDLPHGAIKARVGKEPTIKVDDDDAVLAWAGDTLPDLIEEETIRKVVRKVLVAYVKASGEIPPGVTVTPPATTISITAEGGTDD